MGEGSRIASAEEALREQVAKDLGAPWKKPGRAFRHILAAGYDLSECRSSRATSLTRNSVAPAARALPQRAALGASAGDSQKGNGRFLHALRSISIGSADTELYRKKLEGIEIFGF